MFGTYEIAAPEKPRPQKNTDQAKNPSFPRSPPDFNLRGNFGANVGWKSEAHPDGRNLRREAPPIMLLSVAQNQNKDRICSASRWKVRPSGGAAGRLSQPTYLAAASENPPFRRKWGKIPLLGGVAGEA
jgi:hypothetical protein